MKQQQITHVSDFHRELEVYLKRPIILLGGGQLGRMALKMWPCEILPKPVCILDQNPNLTEIDGIKCELRDNHQFSANNCYVLSFFKEKPELINELFAQIGQPIITVYDILTYFDETLFSNGWSDQISNDELNSLLSAFERPKDQRIVKDVVNWRAKRHLANHYIVSGEDDKYTLSEAVLSAGRHFDLVIDGGAFDGSFMRKLGEQNITFDQAIVVEPDPQSANRVQDWLALGEFSNVAFSKYALSNRNTEQSFNANGLLSARIVKAIEKNEHVQTVSCETLGALLDRSCKSTQNANMRLLIKLHIEGAEWPVIKQAIPALLRFGEVVLLVNLSHDRPSLVELPVLLKTNGFNLSLHSHSLFGEGLTLTAHRSVH